MPTSIINVNNHPSYEDGLDEVILAKMMRDSAPAVKAFQIAQTHGLAVEWVVWFVAGIRQGLPVVTAAQQALTEWNM